MPHFVLPIHVWGDMLDLQDVMGVRAESPAKRLAMIALKVAGGACWVAAYQCAHRETEESGAVLLPVSAIAANVTWEALYVAGGVYKWRDLDAEDRVQTLLNTTWLLQDARWILAMRRSDSSVPVASVVTALAYQASFLIGRPPGDAARVSALIQNLAFSGWLALQEPVEPVPARALRFTALRAFGTAVPTVTSGLLRGYRPTYFLPGLGCVVLDSVRLLRLSKARKR